MVRGRKPERDCLVENLDIYSLTTSINAVQALSLSKRDERIATLSQKREETDGDCRGAFETQRIRKSVTRVASGPLRLAGLGQRKRPQSHRGFRRTRRRRQGRCDQSDHRPCQLACLPRGGAASSVRPGEDPALHAALHAAFSSGWRNRYF